MLENMKAFRMVVECQGFRAAAIAMKLSPAMVSRRIEKLESEVNTQLIKRNSRRISLTAAGEQFYQRCLLIIDEYESCLRDVKSLSNVVSGNLKVGIPHSISHLHIIPSLKAFLERYPDLKLDIVTGNHCMELFSHGFDLAAHCPTAIYTTRLLVTGENIPASRAAMRSSTACRHILTSCTSMPVCCTLIITGAPGNL